jgi:hypothetical protein
MYLKTNDGQQKIAMGVFRAVRDYKKYLETIGNNNVPGSGAR